MDNIPDGYARSRFSSPFLDRSGPYYVKADGERQLVGIRIAKGHINHIETAHGGVLATLADIALSLQVYESEDPPIPVATLSLTTNFVAPARLGDWVEAHAQINRIGKSLAYCSGEIWAKNSLLMTATGVFSAIRRP